MDRPHHGDSAFMIAELPPASVLHCRFALGIRPAAASRSTTPYFSSPVTLSSFIVGDPIECWNFHQCSETSFEVHNFMVKYD
ncbi:hypothetical protein CAEBREN_12589 [Caenorhabditis brenneri]|uniref:Uncharacterized protein n=1 Tax=Caenorhabditis brenneri TaxID=135651 RepID=G0NI16_CAEBE|nr:hypothetical protein CAEBREN_12589 [Caenorhabditis brenneri]